MPEQEDVMPDSSTGDDIEQEVKEAEAPVGESSTPEEPKESAPSGSVNPPDVDEKGVPWKNRESEIRRKVLDEVAPIIRTTIQEILPQFRGQEKAKSEEAPAAKYTIPDLLELKRTNPEYSVWADQEIQRLTEERASERALEKLKAERKKEEDQVLENVAYQNIFRNYPEVYDPSTRQWNASSALYQRAQAIYHSNPAYRVPGGIEVAFDKAYADLTRTEKASLMREKASIKSKEREMQKKQAQAMTAGTSKAVEAAPSSDKAMEKLWSEYNQTKSPEVFAKIVRMRGLMHPTIP